MPPRPPKCRSCHTRTDKPVRGVCRTCYLYYRLAVARGETTWADLERAGLTLPGWVRRRKTK
jgi:hypothetical protein